MANKNVTITVDCTNLPPAFGFTGDVDPTHDNAVEIDSHSVESVTWHLKATNNPLGAVTFAQTNPLVFTGGTEEGWASGTQPTVDRKSDTKVKIHDHNEAIHPTVLHHYYQINVVYNGVTYTSDPEVDEMVNTGPMKT
jgi:hypothetical protein